MPIENEQWLSLIDRRNSILKGTSTAKVITWYFTWTTIPPPQWLQSQQNNKWLGKAMSRLGMSAKSQESTI